MADENKNIAPQEEQINEQLAPIKIVEGDKDKSNDEAFKKLNAQLKAIQNLVGDKNGVDIVEKFNKLSNGAKLERGNNGELTLKVAPGQEKDLQKIEDALNKVSQKEGKNEFITFADGKEGFNQGKEFSVDFKGDIDKEEKVGLSDILPKEVRKVQVHGSHMGREFDMVGTRQGAKGGFFTDNGEYVPVFSNFKITVLEYDENYQSDFDEKKNENIKAYLDMPEFKDFINKGGKEKIPERTAIAEKILNKALDYNIDPYFFLNLVAEDEQKGHIGLFGQGAKKFDDQVNMTVRDLQIAMNRYKSLSKNEPVNNREFTNDFLEFFYGTYQAEGEGRSRERSIQSIQKYKKFYGKDFNEKDFDISRGNNQNIYSSMQSGIEFKGPVGLDNMLKVGQQFLNRKTPYRWGGNSIDGIDCSHFVCKMMGQQYQTAAGLSNWNKCSNVSDGQIQKGDLMFWHKNPRSGGQQQNPIAHVALVLEASNGRAKILQSTSNAMVHGAKLIEGNPNGACITEIPIRHEDVKSGGTNHFFKRPNIYQS